MEAGIAQTSDQFAGHVLLDAVPGRIVDAPFSVQLGRDRAVDALANTRPLLRSSLAQPSNSAAIFDSGGSRASSRMTPWASNSLSLPLLEYGVSRQTSTFGEIRRAKLKNWRSCTTKGALGAKVQTEIQGACQLSKSLKDSS